MAKKVTQGINVDRLDQLIKDLGVRVRLYKSTLAPNMKSLESMDQDLNDRASNNNMVDFDCIETVVLFQQHQLAEQFNLQGTFHVNEVMVSFLSGLTIAPMAKIELLDFEESFYELIQRQEGKNIDILKYNACAIDAVFTYDRTLKEYERYLSGTDFIQENGNIKWISSHKPADRQVYSVYYKYHPVYRCAKAVHRDRFSQYNVRPSEIKAPHKTVNGATYVKMPETWIVQRDYLIKYEKNELYDPNE